MAEKKSHFEKLTEQLRNKQGIKDPAALAAKIGRDKYGKGTMAEAAKEHVSAETVRRRRTPKKVG